jgi:hypothetical protein
MINAFKNTLLEFRVENGLIFTITLQSLNFLFQVLEIDKIFDLLIFEHSFLPYIF